MTRASERKCRDLFGSGGSLFGCSRARRTTEASLGRIDATPSKESFEQRWHILSILRGNSVGQVCLVHRWMGQA